MRRGACHAAAPRETIACPARWSSENWKGFGHEKSSISVSDRCHHRCHCLGDTITSSGVAGRLGWLGCRSRRRTNCWGGDRRNSVQRLRLWPRLWLLRRTGVRLLWRLCPRLLRRVRPSVLWRVRASVRLRSRILRRVWIELLCSRLLRSPVPARILRPSVLSRVSIRLVIARCDAEVRTTKVAERSAAFFVPTRVWLDATRMAEVGWRPHPFRMSAVGPLRRRDGRWECLFIGIHRKSSAHG
jgi:hypothetical protein